MFPTITKEIQEKYENECKEGLYENKVPCICGYYGRACRNMNELANSFLCNGCHLAEFAKEKCYLSEA